MSSYLRRGAAAGLAAGVALALFLLAVGERSIRDAIALEQSTGADDAPFTRPEQVAGGALGALVYGLLLGIVFAIVFAALRHRLTGRTDWHRSVTLAAVGFVAVVVVPSAKYPPNPPGVGDPDTVGRRTALWLLLVAFTVVAAWAAWRLQRWLAGRGVEEARRWPATVACFAALIAVAYVVLPGADSAGSVPADLVWRFRLASLGGQLALWTTLGLVFGWLCTRTRGREGDEALPSVDVLRAD